MDTNLKVTDEPAEVSFADLVSGDNVLNIPLFQRAYRWRGSHYDALWADIQEILDGTTAAQFLGVLVTVSHARQIGRPAIYDVVDGQQRLTTAYLTALAVAQCAVDNDHVDWGIEVARTYLLLRPFPLHPYNTKLVPASADRQQFSDIWERLRTTAEARKPNAWSAAGAPAPPPPFGQRKGSLQKQYSHVERLIRKVYDADGLEGLNRSLSIFVSCLSFVTISLRDPIVAPKIFERLNARGEHITTGDLVRNEIFSKVAADPALAQTIFSNHWEPFAKAFSSEGIDLDKILFPYGLTIDPNTTKADLFNTLRKKWAALQEPVQIIAHMQRFAPYFLALAAGKTFDGAPQFEAALLRLHRMNAPTSIYPFIMQLGVAVEDDKQVPEESAVEILLAVESFLFRRAICGLEPTGLHAVFKGMWGELQEKGLPFAGSSIVALISSRTTVPWPSDTAFSESILSGNLYGRGIRDFAIREYELACHGESPADAFTVEHILPQTITDEWSGFDPDQHKELIHTWGNLIPLTGTMNPGVGQACFAKKREKYCDSVFASAREIATRHPDWTPESIRERSRRIAAWAITRWPFRP
jgi:hypothetical protein